MRALPFALAALFGCAPSTQSLVDHHHSREALCAIGWVSPEDDTLIRETLARELAPRVQVSYVDVGQSDLRAITLRVATNALPIDELRLRAVPASKQLVSWELDPLTQLTGETLPEGREVGPNAAEGITLFMIAIMTVGIVRLEPSSRSHTEYPSEGEKRQAAPRAYDLSHLLKSECTRPESTGVGARCTFAFAMRADAPEPPAVDLVVELSAHAEHRETCSIARSFHIPLDAPSDEFRPLPLQ